MESKIIDDYQNSHNFENNIFNDNLLSKKKKFIKLKLKLNKNQNRENDSHHIQTNTKIHAKKKLKRKCLISNNEGINPSGKINKCKRNFSTIEKNKEQD